LVLLAAPNKRTTSKDSYVWRTATSGELSDAQLAQNRSSWQRQIGEPRLENSHVLRTATSGELLDAQLAQNDRSSWQRQIGELRLENSYAWRTVTSGEQKRHVWQLQCLVKSVRVEAAPKMILLAKLQCDNRAINSRALKNIWSSLQIYIWAITTFF